MTRLECHVWFISKDTTLPILPLCLIVAVIFVSIIITDCISIHCTVATVLTQFVDKSAHNLDLSVPLVQTAHMFCYGTP